MTSRETQEYYGIVSTFELLLSNMELTIRMHKFLKLLSKNFSESKDECATSITSNMSEMGIESAAAVDCMRLRKQKSFSRGDLLSEAYKDLLSIRSTFISSFAQMRHALAKSR